MSLPFASHVVSQQMRHTGAEAEEAEAGVALRMAAGTSALKGG